jgi:protein dithiol oxidoreductase (disulfide-forming)
MKRILISLVALAAASFAQAQPLKYVQGKHYTNIAPQRTTVPAGKVEVLEVFSYGCPACNQFRPFMRQLATSLPKNAQLAYLPASWNAAENWPTFQRAFITAQLLGVADKAHDPMYDAIWTSGELGVTDPQTRRLKTKLPTIEDISKFYARTTGVKPQDFVNGAKSYSVDLKMKQADKQITDMQISGTPTLVVAGKYRVNNEAFASAADIIDCVNFLVAREAGTAPKPAAAAATPAPAKKP